MLMRRSRTRRLRAFVPLLAALAVVAPLAWMWASSFAPSTYSATEMGYVDDGGAPLPGSTATGGRRRPSPPRAGCRRAAAGRAAGWPCRTGGW